MDNSFHSETQEERICLSPPHLTGTELDLIKEALNSNSLAPWGSQVDAFEKEVAGYLGMKSALAVSSGTAALHLALRLLGVKPGDEVICPTLTFVATANPILYLGAQPLFIDSEARSWNMDPELLADLLESRARSGRLPKAIIVADILGQSADYDAIQPLIEHFDIPLVEDAAEALGASYRGKKVGSFADLCVLSFNGNKIITTSGGGMLLANDESSVARAHFLAAQAREPAPYYEHKEVGYNYRLSNILGAVGRSQLSTLDERVARRREIFDFYENHLSELEGLEFMPEMEGSFSSRWLTCLLIEPELFGASRDSIRLALEAQNIESRPTWKPLHLQPLFEGVETAGGEVSHEIFKKGLCLPSGHAMTETQLEQVVQTFRDLYHGEAGRSHGLHRRAAES